MSGTAVPPPLPPLFVVCRLPRYLASPCPQSLLFLPPHAVVRELGLLLTGTFDVDRGGGVYYAPASGTAVPASSLCSLYAHAVVYCWYWALWIPRLKTVTESSCMMSRCLEQPRTLSLYALAHAVVYGIYPLVITLEVIRGVEWYDVAVSGRAVPSLPLLTACRHCYVLVWSCWIRRYPLLLLVAVLSVRCGGV